MGSSSATVARLLAAACCLLLLADAQALVKISSARAESDEQEFQILLADQAPSAKGALSPSELETHAEARQASVTLRPANAEPSDEEPKDVIKELVDDNYLDSLASALIKENSNKDKISNLFDDLQSNNHYNKAHKKNNGKANKADWWSKLAQSLNSHGNKKGSKPPPKLSTPIAPTAAPTYKEQPLNQNVILTARHQLMAIREKHRALITKAVPQLIKLDQKLIDSYKLCFKRNHPLYGGMLYRTRDFATRLARDIRHERQVLESMTKQIQKTLKEQAKNKTTVKEFKRLLTTTEVPLKLTNEPLHTDRKDSARDNDRANGRSPNKSTSDKPDIVKSGEGQSTTDNQKYNVHINEANLKKQLKRTQALIDRVNASSHDLSAIVDDILIKLKLIEPPSHLRRKQNKWRNQDDQYNTYGSPSSMWLSGPYEQKKVRKMLKSPASNFLEKYGRLTMGNLDAMIGANSGRPLSANNMDNIDVNNLPEPKPLFDATYMTYNEPSDADLGFETIVTV